jgi:hypothetical protein
MQRFFSFFVSSARLSPYRPILICAREYARSFFQEQVDAARLLGSHDEWVGQFEGFRGIWQPRPYAEALGLISLFWWDRLGVLPVWLDNP